MRDLWRYPFLPAAREAVQELQLEALLDDPLYGEANSIAVMRLEAAAAGGKIATGTPSDEREEQDQLLGFLISRLILAAADDPNLASQVALAEAMRAQRFLATEEEAGLAHIASELGLSARRENGGYVVPFSDYLTAAASLREGKWKLVNRGVSHGMVSLPREALERLLREVIVNHLRQLPEAPDGIAERYAPEIEALLGVIKQRREKTIREMGKLDFGKAPPCFNGHLADLQAGINLPHPARFFLTTFLTALGQEPEQIMQLYATAPDFKESVTRYQVEHITGKISGTEYDTPGCETLISQGVCPGGNALCREIPHPLSYYRVMAEREKPDAVRRKRLRLAEGRGDAGFWQKLPLSAAADAPQRSLAAALQSNSQSKVRVQVGHFRARRDKRGDEFVRWASARLADDTSSSLETLPLTQWELALPLAHAKARGEPVEVTLLPVKLGNQSRLHVLAVG